MQFIYKAGSTIAILMQSLDFFRSNYKLIIRWDQWKFSRLIYASHDLWKINIKEIKKFNFTLLFSHLKYVYELMNKMPLQVAIIL